MKSLFTLFVILTSYNSVLGQWQIMSSAPVTPISYIVNVNGILYASSNGTGVYKSTDSTHNWQQINNGLNNLQSKEVLQLLFYNSQLFLATVDGIYKSVDGGLNWTKKSNGIVIGSGALYLFTSSIFVNNGVLLTGAYSGIYSSTDNGDNWVVSNIFGTEVSANFFVNHNGMLFAARESINQPFGYSSTNNGLSWVPFTNNGFPIITYLSEGTNLWAGTIEGVWITTNNGQNWTSRSNGLSADPYSSSVIRVNGTLITALKFGGSGVYKSIDDGMNWTNIGDGLPFLNSIDLLIIYGNKILAATSGGIYERNISEIVTSISKQSNEIPNSFKLYQNYPNPFNPTSLIKFDIPEKQFTKLTVFDLSGKAIATLINNVLSPGVYEFTFDGSNIASGVYFYRIESGKYQQSKIMVLVK